MSWEPKASSTTAKTALGLSIGALGVELLGGGGGGILSGLLGRPQNAIVTPDILPMIMSLIPMLNQRGYCCNQNAVCALESEVAQLRAEKYADSVGINSFKESAIALEKSEARFGELIRDLNREAVDNRVAAARQEEQIKCLQKEVDYKLAAVAATAKAETESLRTEVKLGFTELSNAIQVESERRAVADNSIREWADCRFVQYKKVIDSSQLCPPVRLADGGQSNAVQANLLSIGGNTVQG
jgi:hypothetical protein